MRPCSINFHPVPFTPSACSGKSPQAESQVLTGKRPAACMGKGKVGDIGAGHQ